MAGNLVVNVVSILVVGALVLGYKFIGELQQGAEKKVGIGVASAPSNPAPDAAKH